MIKYNFIVDKETCFVYWVQSLIKWGWYFDKKEFDYYRGLAKPLTNNEKKSLELLKSILQKNGNQFLWLWNRYAEKKIENPEEYRIWKVIRLNLSDKFEAVWAKEKKNLQCWQKILNKYSFRFLAAPYKKIYNFFKAKTPKNKQTINVKLCFHWDKKFPAAHVQRNFKNLIILNISNTKQIEIKRIINILAHETIHKIEYASPLSPILLKNSYKKIIKPKRIEIEGIKWKHLLTETIITSMASLRFNSYIDRILIDNPERGKPDKIKELNFRRIRRNRKNYSFLIKIAASRIEELTTGYLDKNKIIDQNYCDAIASAWLALIKK